MSVYTRNTFADLTEYNQPLKSKLNLLLTHDHLEASKTSSMRLNLMKATAIFEDSIFGEWGGGITSSQFLLEDGLTKTEENFFKSTFTISFTLRGH